MAISDLLHSSGIPGHPRTHRTEEEYFFRQNEELIRRKRAELDEQREKRQAEERRAVYWMRCPKCGDKMEEHVLLDVTFERCAKCEGVYFDKGELEMLIDSRPPVRFFRALGRKMF